MLSMEILLVEDNPSDLELAQRALREHNLGASVRVARDGEEALDFIFGQEQFAGKRELPRVILLDLKLPLVDGIEVLRQVRANPRTRYVPVVALTASNQARDVTECYALGVNSYITKPVDFDRFREAMRTIGEYWLLLNRSPAAAI
ncbi:MAG: response regulator [Betaproteobacteria bacterium]|nr:response regulator [Betaproteobacteria bacterium]MBI2959210.1 response regulator [Betaproteobacteria bacterium]